MANIDKIVKSKYPPKQKNVNWIDTSGDKPEMKTFFNGKWTKIEGGGGGNDYSSLTNKPSINGVEIDGNKTSQDLGVYSKPSNGIPESDLSSDVQQALQKHFKGWYNTLEELEAAHTATEGDSAYVKDLSPANTWSIYVYDSTASSNNYWADSGTKADTSNVQLVPSAVKKAIYDIASNAAFINDNGYSSQLNVIQAWSEELLLLSITANFDQTGVTVYTTDSLNSLKAHLTVTATYDDFSTLVLPSSSYVLSGSLTEGVSVITVTYMGKTDTFDVVVSASPYLYVLPSTFTSDGSNRVDTNVMFEAGKKYTILGEATPTSTVNAIRYIFSNRKASALAYFALQRNNSNAVWGMGIPFGSAVSIGNNTTFRIASVLDVTSVSDYGINSHIKIGSGNIQQKSNTYTGDITDPTTVNPMMIGDSVYNGEGFIGTVNTFVIMEGEMDYADIADFLNNGI